MNKYDILLGGIGLSLLAAPLLGVGSVALVGLPLVGLALFKYGPTDSYDCGTISSRGLYDAD